MTLKEFQVEAKKTAIYDDKFKVIYPILGLVDEYGELLEKLEPFTNYPSLEIVKEASDCLWYISTLCTDLNINLQDLYTTDELSIMFDTNITFIILSKIVGKIKKWIRDNNCGEMNMEIKMFITQCLVIVFDTIHAIIVEEGYTLEAILQMNIEKLKSRQERGVLQGSGDSR